MEGKSSWACFVVIAFVIVVSSSMSSCDGTPTPTPTSTATVTATPTSFYPAPILISPAFEATIGGKQEFSWHWDGVLQEGERLALRIWRSGKQRLTVFMCGKDDAMWDEDKKYSYPLDNPPSGFGHYQWQVAVVRIEESGNESTLCESPIWLFVWSDMPPTATPTDTPTATPVSPTATPTPPTPPETPTQTPVPPTATATHTPRPPTPTPVPTVALTIYLRDTLTETGFAALSGDQANAGEIYEEGKFVYGEAAVQIGETIYHFDMEEAGLSEPEQLPEPWRVEFEFDEGLKARTGNQAGYHFKKAQFWVGYLDEHSAVGEDNPYSLTMELYEGDALEKSIQVFFAVKDAPGREGGSGSEVPPIRPTRS